MNLETMEFDELMESINKKVTELDGYIEIRIFPAAVSAMAAKEAGKAPRITARIPSDHLSAFITEVEANGM